MMLAVATIPPYGWSQALADLGQISPIADPTVKAIWAGIRRVHGAAEDHAAPVTVPLLRRMIASSSSRSSPTSSSRSRGGAESWPW